MTHLYAVCQQLTTQHFTVNHILAATQCDDIHTVPFDCLRFHAAAKVQRIMGWIVKDVFSQQEHHKNLLITPG